MAKVPVIDDDPLVRSTLCAVLEMASHAVAEATDGEEGLARYAAEHPDVVVCDILMPGKEGIETIRELRRIAPGLKIVGMSGGGRTGTLDFLDMAGALGANTVLAKPFTTRDLLDTIARLMR
jgi:CheY-like chemotaxis protein